MQVSSRFLLVWGIIEPYPFVSAAPTYSSMLIAWSVTEVIRYSFFATAILGMCPGFLLWLRYNTFFVLYPVGIFSEVSLIWLTTKIGGIDTMIRFALYAILAIYVPGMSTLPNISRTICDLMLSRFLRPLHIHDEAASPCHQGCLWKIRSTLPSLPHACSNEITKYSQLDLFLACFNIAIIL